MDTKQRLDEIKQYEAAAAKGPWTFDPENNGQCFALGYGIYSDDISTVLHVPMKDGEANAEFVARAREDIPWLVGELEEAKARLSELEEKILHAACECSPAAPTDCPTCQLRRDTRKERRP